MTRRVLPLLGAIVAGRLLVLGMPGASAQTAQPSAEVESTFDTGEARVLKVYSAEEGPHRFVAYVVKRRDFEVVVSDPLAQSHFQEGDKIRFMAQKVSLPGSTKQISTLNFTLLETQPPERGGTAADETSGSSAEQDRRMKIAQGDLDAATNETERFYALNRAAKQALQEGETEKARALATELQRLAPKFRTDWNYGNAIQDANQVLGQLALLKGDVVEAKRLLLASADSKGSPQMNSFGPNMQLAKALLEKGEPDVVLEYFRRCGTFWKMGEDRLAAWTAMVKGGGIPDFGANLKY